MRRSIEFVFGFILIFLGLQFLWALAFSMQWKVSQYPMLQLFKLSSDIFYYAVSAAVFWRIRKTVPSWMQPTVLVTLMVFVGLSLLSLYRIFA